MSGEPVQEGGLGVQVGSCQMRSSAGDEVRSGLGGTGVPHGEL